MRSGSTAARDAFRKIASQIAENPTKVVEGFDLSEITVNTLVGQVKGKWVALQVAMKDVAGTKIKAGDPVTSCVLTAEQIEALGPK